MIPNEKFKFEMANQNGKKVVRLKGIIDEDTDFEPIKKFGLPLAFNFKEVTAINSIGIRTWVNFVKELGTSGISYEECPPLIVRQMNMVPSFVGGAQVASVYAPYVCEECDKEKLVAVTADKFGGGNPQIPESFKCEFCGKGDMELDGHPQQYFAFAK